MKVLDIEICIVCPVTIEERSYEKLQTDNTACIPSRASSFYTGVIPH